jgi:hypothetical protein
MVVSTLRPLLILVAGAAAGSLITFGLLNHRGVVQANTGQAELPPKLLRAPSPTKQGGDADNQPTITANTQETGDPQETIESKAAAAMIAARQRVPMRPIPKATITFQANGLPVGVTPNAGLSDAYKRLPGVQPPLINRDGRDLGPEAIQMLEAHREEVPFPGGIPSASASPMPFPSSVEEANRQPQGYASPSPGP